MRPAERLEHAHENLGELGLAVAADAGDAVDLAAPNGEARAVEKDVAVAAGAAELRDGQHRLADPLRWRRLLGDGGADDQAGQIGDRNLARIGGRHGLAAAHHGDAVGVGDHLAELVGDEHDRGAAGGDAAHDLREAAPIPGR